MSIHLTNKLSINQTLINWYLENITLEVDEDMRNIFINLKNGVEGWKKGTQLRNPQFVPKNSMEKIKENLSLYLNQITNANYSTIQKKIMNDIDNSLDAQNLFIDLVLTNCLCQPNNLLVIVQLLLDLKYIEPIIEKEEKCLFEGELMRETDTENYDQLCIDNKANLIYKSGFIFLGMIYNKSNNIPTTKLLKYFEFLETHILNPNYNKELSEKYIDIYVELIRLVESKFKLENREMYNVIFKKLEEWKSLRQKFTNRARFSILDYIESVVL